MRDLKRDIRLARRGELGPQYITLAILDIVKGIKKIYRRAGNRRAR
jgi:hypothetical protein